MNFEDHDVRIVDISSAYMAWMTKKALFGMYACLVLEPMQQELPEHSSENDPKRREDVEHEQAVETKSREEEMRQDNAARLWDYGMEHQRRQPLEDGAKIEHDQCYLLDVLIFFALIE